jgi:replication-associated recombination protein RarA
MNPYWSAKTPDGQRLDETVSKLQKCVRRGREADAIYLVKQLYFGRKQKLFGCDIWRKLHIYAAEEVGLADILLPMRLQDLERAADRVNAMGQHDGITQHADLMYVVMAVMILCRVKKSRAVDNAIHWFDRNAYTPPTDEELEASVKEDQPIPEPMDDAIDRHTTRGRQMGRGDEHFYANGARLENESEVPDFQPPRACPHCGGTGRVAA